MEIGSIKNHTNYSPNFGIKVPLRVAKEVAIASTKDCWLYWTPKPLKLLQKIGSPKIVLESFENDGYAPKVLGCKFTYSLDEATASIKREDEMIRGCFNNRDLFTPTETDYTNNLIQLVKDVQKDIIVEIMSNLVVKGRLRRNLVTLRQDFPQNIKLINSEWKKLSEADGIMAEYQSQKLRMLAEYALKHPILAKIKKIFSFE